MDSITLRPEFNINFNPELLFIQENRPERELKNIQAEELVKKAKSLLNRLKGKEGLKARNLFLMAELALEKGNILQASIYAQKVINSLEKEANPLLKSLEQKNKIEKALEERIEGILKPPTKKKFRDVSSDINISFKYPRFLTARQSFLEVPAHEREHVGNALSVATLQGKKIFAIVSLKTLIDPVTGELFVTGGFARIYTFSPLKDIFTVPKRGIIIDRLV